MKMKYLFPALLAFAAFAPSAQAANPATVTTDLNLRAGPSKQYPVVTVVPQSSAVMIYGCNANVSWCDIAYGRYRGWAAAGYIRVASGGSAVIVTPAYVARVGWAPVTYSRVYWDTYYRSYPWYGNWNTYYAPPPPRRAVPAGTTSTGTAGCVGRACGGRQAVTGPYGGRATRAGGCVNGVCGGRKSATGPQGRTATKSGYCNARTGNCAARRTGPRGNTTVRRRARP